MQRPLARNMAIFNMIVMMIVVSCLVPGQAQDPCITMCDGLLDGDYQSCIGCSVFATCSNGFFTDNRPCPAGLVWDDNSKRCEFSSTTCTDAPGNGCITSCSGIPDGDYQSCNGCDVYATCSGGSLFDDRPCPTGLVWDDNSKRCEFSSTTCTDGPVVPPVVVPEGKCIHACNGVPNGDYQSCNGCNVYASCSNGLLYDDRPCPANLVWDDKTKRCEYVSETCRSYSSCYDVFESESNRQDGVYIISKSGALYSVFCEFFPSHIYTYIARTNLTTINIEDLFNNRQEVMIRHRQSSGNQFEAKIEQIQEYEDRDISIQYNSNLGYNGLVNPMLGPYLYIGLLPINGITHQLDTQGYSVNGNDFTFTNCDGNPNSYFAMLFNAEGNSFSTTGSNNPLISRWKEEATAVPSNRNFPDKFFSSYEIHFGGCGGLLTTPLLADVTGTSIGLRYDIPYSSCLEVLIQLPNAPNGVYTLANEQHETYSVFCEFFPSHIYTYIARTNLTTINIEDLFNNRQEVMIRHRQSSGNQFEAKIEQIQEYEDRDISIQYNSNLGYNGLVNPMLGPYLYIGLLPINGITHQLDTQGYSVNGNDFTFTNCDGNPNSYFAMLFNAEGNSFSTTGSNNPLISRWKEEATAVPSNHNFPDKFFSSYEIHFGGCGGLLTTPLLADVTGTSIGLRYDFSQAG